MKKSADGFFFYLPIAFKWQTWIIFVSYSVESTDWLQMEREKSWGRMKNQRIERRVLRCWENKPLATAKEEKQFGEEKRKYIEDSSKYIKEMKWSFLGYWFLLVLMVTLCVPWNI